MDRVLKTESLWAEPVGGDRYRLRNVPFLVFGFSEQDVITAEENNGALRVTGVAIRGGRSTYRLVLPEDANEERRTILAGLDPIERTRLHSRTSHSSLCRD